MGKLAKSSSKDCANDEGSAFEIAEIRETLSLITEKLDELQTVYIFGDFNINLLKCGSHPGTQKFIDVRYIAGVFPLINKPTRITEDSATIIDNVITNNLKGNTISGIPINDISNHLLVFVITKHVVVKKTVAVSAVRHNTGACQLINLRKALSNINWNVVYETNDVDIAYNNFVHIYTQLFNECCPVRKYKYNNDFSDKPWFTQTSKCL